MCCSKFIKHFGEYNYYFNKESKVDRKMYNILILERFIVGLSIVITYQLKFSLIIPMVLFLLLGIFVFIKKPYKFLRHNVRFMLNMFITIIILAIYTFYKFQTIESQNKQKIFFFLPLIVCVLLIICIVYSVVSLIYEIYLKCKQTP